MWMSSSTMRLTSRHSSTWQIVISNSYAFPMVPVRRCYWQYQISTRTHWMHTLETFNQPPVLNFSLQTSLHHRVESTTAGDALLLGCLPLSTRNPESQHLQFVSFPVSYLALDTCWHLLLEIRPQKHSFVLCHSYIHQSAFTVLTCRPERPYFCDMFRYTLLNKCLK